MPAFQIDKKLMQAANMIPRVHQEVSIHSRLKHPSILELYAFFEDANYVYLVLEYCQNGELQRYFKEHNKVLKEHEGRLICIKCYFIIVCRCGRSTYPPFFVSVYFKENLFSSKPVY